jgi:hypothetical protein
LQKLVEDMRLRIVRSAFKLTKAVAVANSTSVATKDHADYALRFVQDKVNFLRSMKVQDARAAIEKPSVNDIAKRREMIEKAFRGKRFTIDEVTKLVAERMDGPCDIRTIQRDLGVLKAISLKKPKGHWSLK